MVSSFEILLTILIIYFAARVTRMEERMNQLEANFNRHIKDGSMEESNTVHMGKAFGNDDVFFHRHRDGYCQGHQAVRGRK
ncbi:hypothetical protein [Selenomonas sp. AB3002]|uniref:hypothetical protein n=1 Tax=Selenomonas sp. AB3002 TaxID=1392502 RepID=UPI000AF20385